MRVRSKTSVSQFMHLRLEKYDSFSASKFVIESFREVTVHGIFFIPALEITCRGKPGHASAFIEDTAVKKTGEMIVISVYSMIQF